MSNRFDVAIVEAEIASQLALKALIVKIGFEPPRTHMVRQLFSFIIDNKLLPDNMLNIVRNYVKKNREKLIILERARIVGQYGASIVDHDEAEIAVNTAKEVLSVVEKLWKMVI
ncbi:HEPN domain-containing protein [Staphylothermus hellenicus]|uniref:HEPN domain-containing protein n=1 Tax=Staphylothermus hellenicus TaxID=84599 RepID=UPI0001C4497F|nr:HEPN domain-containing protein [Staphylothermus hellenicus]